MKATVTFALFASSVALADIEDDLLPGSNAAIQERAFRMTYEVDVGGGVLPLDPFTKQLYAQGSMVIHFSDVIAWQVARGAICYNMASGLRQQLERDFAVVSRAFDQVKYFIGSDLMFKPFYGKASVANRFLLHFEAYLLLGGSVYGYENGTALGKPRPGLDIGGGVRFFHTKWLSYRVEVLDSIVFIGSIANVLAINLMAAINIGSTE